MTGLTVASREGYLSLLIDALKTNLSQANGIDDPEKPLSRRDVEQSAIDLEYEAFSKSTVISLYRRSVSKIVSTLLKLNLIFVYNIFTCMFDICL